MIDGELAVQELVPELPVTALEYEVVRVQVARVDAAERDRIGTEVDQGMGIVIPDLGRDDIAEVIRA